MDKNASSSQMENGNSNLPATENKEHSGGGLFDMVLHHRRIIIGTLILSAAGAFIYLLAATPIYTSEAKIYAEQTGPKMISEYEGFMTGSKNYLYTQKELIVSTPIVAQAAGRPEMSDMKMFERIDNKTAYIRKGLKVSVGKKDDIITVAFDSPYPKEAAGVVNAVLDSYVEYHSTHKKSTVLEVLKILQKEKIKHDGELSGQIKEMLEFTKKNGILTFNDNSEGHIVIQRLAKLSEALTQAQLETINAKANYEAVMNMRDDVLKIKQMAMAQSNQIISILSRDREIELESQIRKLEVELADLRISYTDSHPAVQAVQQRIDFASEQLKKYDEAFVDSYIEIQKQKYLMAQQMEEQLAKSFEIQQNAAQDAGTKNAEYAMLCSEMKRTERLCEILDERIKQLNVDEDTGALNISILEVARIPDSPSKPQKARVMTMAFMLGLMLSVGLVLLREQLDNRLRSPEEANSVLGIPVLGIIPNISGHRKSAAGIKGMWKKVSNRTSGKPVVEGPAADFAKKLQGLQSTLKSGQEAVQGVSLSQREGADTAAAVTGAEVKEKLPDKKNIVVIRGQKVRFQPKSIAAEAYRTIRTAIFFGVPKGQAKTILITSPTAGDGKSTLVSNLGLTMAQAGQKTIVVDCDFRRPMQHNIFDIGRETGLSNCITGNATLDDVIQRGPIENIDVLVCGAEVPNPSELLNSEAFGRILNELSSRYDRVLIDSPPVMPVADSQILGAICDITILVLRAEKSTRKMSKLACENLTGVGSHLLGTVINDVPQPRSRYGYYHYHRYGYSGYGGYGYEYGYGYYDTKEKIKESEKVYA
jgi:capsular exopolysaccharide synthesis family protein